MKHKKTGTSQSHYTTLILPPCRICQGEATGYHFGAISCEACKAFFRRSLVQKTSPSCKKKGKCVIGPAPMHNCAACRLRKCLENEMSKDSIRRGRFSLTMRTEAIKEVNQLEGKAQISENQSDDGSVSSTSSVSLDASPAHGLAVWTGNGSQDNSSKCSSDLFEGLTSPEMDLDFDFRDNSLASVMLLDTQEVLPAITGTSLVRAAEFEFLIDSLVVVQESIYPDLKKYFDTPLEEIHRNIHFEMTLKQEIFKGVFGVRKPVSTEQFQDVFASTGLDLDDRLTQFNLYGASMEAGIQNYMNFASMAPGIQALEPGNVNTLVKAGHLEFWFFGSHMLFNKELGVAMCYDGSQNGTREHMTRFFDEDWIDTNFDYADSLSKLKMTFVEIALIRAIVITSGDRCTISDKGAAQALQEHFFECLRYHLKKTCARPVKRLADVIQKLVNARELNEINLRANRKFLSEWGFLMNGYPLWKDMLAYEGS